MAHARAQYTRAEPLARKALALQQQARGPDHPDVAITLSTLAAILVGRRKYDQAEPLYRRSIAILEKTFGPEHRDAAMNYNELAAVS